MSHMLIARLQETFLLSFGVLVVLIAILAASHLYRLAEVLIVVCIVLLLSVVGMEFWEIWQ